MLDCKTTIKEEIRALEKNGRWELAELPEGNNLMGSMQIFTIKYKANGSVDIFKVRLIAKGFMQSYKISYQETFAPIAKLNTVSVLFSLAINRD